MDMGWGDGIIIKSQCSLKDKHKYVKGSVWWMTYIIIVVFYLSNVCHLHPCKLEIHGRLTGAGAANGGTPGMWGATAGTGRWSGGDETIR